MEIVLTTISKKQRVNSKKWVHCDTLVASYPDESYIADVITGRGFDGLKLMITKMLIHNVPENLFRSEDAFLAWWKTVICMTPFGAPVYEHDYNQIMNPDSKSGVTYAFLNQ